MLVSSFGTIPKLTKISSNDNNLSVTGQYPFPKATEPQSRHIAAPRSQIKQTTRNNRIKSTLNPGTRCHAGWWIRRFLSHRVGLPSFELEGYQGGGGTRAAPEMKWAPRESTECLKEDQNEEWIYFWRPNAFFGLFFSRNCFGFFQLLHHTVRATDRINFTSKYFCGKVFSARGRKSFVWTVLWSNFFCKWS